MSDEFEADEVDDAVDPEDADFEEADIEDDEFDDDADIDDALGDDEVVVAVEEEEEEEEEAPIPATRARTSDEDEDEDDIDPDDVEADLDTILKDRIASGDDSEDDEEEEVPLDRSDPELSEGIIQKREGEFTCNLCFMIVHPRQFGRKGALTCPVGDEDCPSIAIIAKQS